MLFVSQEERRASDTVLFTSENNDTANQSVDTSFFTNEKKSYDQSAGFSSAKRLFLSRCFLARKSRYVYNNILFSLWLILLEVQYSGECIELVKT